jgi:hypothetical protein
MLPAHIDTAIPLNGETAAVESCGYFAGLRPLTLDGPLLSPEPEPNEVSAHF